MVAKKKEEISIEKKFLRLMGMQTIPVDEFLSFIAEAPKEERASYIRRFCESAAYRKDCIKGLAEIAWHPRVVLALPEGAPPYRNTHDLTSAPMTLYKAIKQVVYFVEKHPSFIQNQLKRESVFMKILETLSKEEAQILLSVKDGDTSKYKGFDENTIREAYPGWLPKKPESGE